MWHKSSQKNFSIGLGPGQLSDLNQKLKLFHCFYLDWELRPIFEMSQWNFIEKDLNLSISTSDSLRKVESTIRLSQSGFPSTASNQVKRSAVPASILIMVNWSFLKVGPGCSGCRWSQLYPNSVTRTHSLSACQWLFIVAKWMSLWDENPRKENKAFGNRPWVEIPGPAKCFFLAKSLLKLNF